MYDIGSVSRPGGGGVRRWGIVLKPTTGMLVLCRWVEIADFGLT